MAVSVDPAEVTRKHAAKQGYSFTFLSDPNAEVIRRYDLFHAGGGTDGGDISRSAEFLLDASGIVRWANVTQGEKARPTGAQLVKALEQLEAETPAPKQ